MKLDSPIKLSVYKKMTFHIFHAINIIKKIKVMPEIGEEQKIEFKFKKHNMKRLLIFDLDETLIHCQRDEYIQEDDVDAF
jgi:hypothetical protein